ncbi:hypothetical protein [Shewanella kaireitica]|uniref:hypothetical protein n=1 Tax=Shewanella kaireitica TaxID=212021 RepID=UPI0020107EA0|nr:hypothetical protein [Shewanella kaireitica]MCL1095854.1 hypothetical protein [Shewanella kaireitica]
MEIHVPSKKRYHQVVVSESPKPQPYICNEQLIQETEVQKNNGKSGDICYLTGYQLDHGESEIGKSFRLNITPCDYAEHMAANRLASMCNETRINILNQMRLDPKLYLEAAVPANITVNVVVLSRNNFLAVKRSRTVDTAKRQWVPGPTETMTLKDYSPGNEENLFKLAARCLKEELNLEDDHYGDIHFTWFGLSEVTLGALAIAVVEITSELTEGQVIELAQNAHSSFEFEQLEWIPFNKKDVESHIQSEGNLYMGKNWINFSKLSLLHALRYQSLLRLPR